MKASGKTARFKQAIIDVDYVSHVSKLVEL